MKRFFCVGTYTEPILFGTGEVFHGKGRGISICSLEDGRIRVLKEIAVRNPSYLCIDEAHRKIYSTNEMKDYLGEYGGGITQLTYDADGELHVDCTFGTHGTDPCHVAIAPNKAFVSVANFADGTVTVFPLDENGNLQPDHTLFRHEGNSTHPVRQRGPHAHSAVFSPIDSFMLVPDLGIDRVVAYGYEGSLAFRVEAWDTPVQAGSGPRFGEFSKDGKEFYLINEISSQVTHFHCENSMLFPRETVSTLPDDFTGPNICSDLHITPDGRYLYASNRGHDSIACYQIGANGDLQFLQRQPCGGKTPRNFAIDPLGEFVLVGNQDSDTIVVFKICDNGLLEERARHAFATPVCIRFFEQTVF